MKQATFWERLAPLLGAQFLGVFNDHAFKTITVLAAVSVSGGYSRDAAFLSFVTMAFVLPFILFSETAGFFADKCSKRAVLCTAKLSETLIMLAGVFFLANVKAMGPFPLVFILFLIALQTAFFYPAFNGALPEIFKETEISRANGYSVMFTFMGIILGVGGGFLLKTMVGDDLYKCGLFFVAIGVAGLLFAIKIQPGKQAAPDKKWEWGFLTKYVSGIKYLVRQKKMFPVALGESYFYVYGSLVQSILIIYAIYRLRIDKDDAVNIGLLQLSPALGMGLGCLLAGRLSRGKVELGLVPFGGAGLVLFLFLAAVWPGEPFYFGSLIVYPVFILMINLAGVSGGLFVVPLKAYMQERTLESERGRFFGSLNTFCFSLILASSLLMFFVSSRPENNSDPGFINYLTRKVCMSLDPTALLILLSLMTVCVCAYMFRKMPEFLFRSAILVFTRSMYRMRVTGAENLPERGPALLVANHISFLDGFLIMSCTSRTVHFLMHEDYYRLPLLYPLVKWAGFIEVPSSRKVKKMAELFQRVRELLERGEVVCVFPEGRITRNGIMNEFKKGVGMMIPEGMDVPVIPLRLGMLWGSMFSYYYGKIKVRFPKEFPHPASITIGRPVPKDTSPFRLRQILSELAADTEMEPRREERPLHYNFAKTAQRRPFKKILFDADGKGISNFSLFLRSVILSRKIRRIVPADRKYVGVLLPNTTIASATMLGVLNADKVPAVMNYTASAESMREAMRKAGISHVLTSRRFIDKINMAPMEEMVFLEDVAAGVTRADKIIWGLLCALAPYNELMAVVAPETHRDVFNTAALLFSSGSTGSPKGVMLSHHNINSDVYSFLRIVGWRDDDSLVGNLPMFHSYGFTTLFWLPLMARAKVVYLPNPLDAAAVGRVVDENKLTVLLATPTFLQTYMKKCTAEQFRSLRLVVTGAERLRQDIAEKFKKMTGLTLTEGYGCTELSPVVTINVSNSILDIGIREGRRGSIGPPMPGIAVKIVDIATGSEELPPGHEGLMLVRGPNVMQGYLNDPEKTAAVLRDGWYNTGDVARMDEDGRITITGRLSRFSKIGGEMVPHQLVESHINEILRTEACEIAVCGLPDKAKGEKLAVLHTGLSMPASEIVDKLRKKGLPNLWIPKASEFHKIDRMPLLGSGKLDLCGLRRLADELARKCGAGGELEE